MPAAARVDAGCERCFPTNAGEQHSRGVPFVVYRAVIKQAARTDGIPRASCCRVVRIKKNANTTHFFR